MKAVCLPTSFVLALAMILMVAPVNLHAQPWIQNTGQLVTQNFYDIQRAFNNYWKNKNTKERGKGWRPFKRWEWFWGQRVYPTGQFPNPMQLLVESQSRVCATGNGRLAAANWTSMGPNDSPGGSAARGFGAEPVSSVQPVVVTNYVVVTNIVVVTNYVMTPNTVISTNGLTAGRTNFLLPDLSWVRSSFCFSQWLLVCLCWDSQFIGTIPSPRS